MSGLVLAASVIRLPISSASQSQLNLSPSGSLASPHTNPLNIKSCGSRLPTPMLLSSLPPSLAQVELRVLEFLPIALMMGTRSLQ